ncbi:hypothetical protein KRR40_42100 [Niabella defluvii]|nr:hypothetical protein KRR40_42100 [Niabella sp. I65]
MITEKYISDHSIKLSLVLNYKTRKMMPTCKPSLLNEQPDRLEEKAYFSY